MWAGTVPRDGEGIREAGRSLGGGGREGDGCVCFLDFGCGFLGVYLCRNFMHFKYVLSKVNRGSILTVIF